MYDDRPEYDDARMKRAASQMNKRDVSDNDFTPVGLNVGVQLIPEHEHYVHTVETQRGFAVAQGRFSQLFCMPHLQSSVTPRVAEVLKLGLLTTKTRWKISSG